MTKPVTNSLSKNNKTIPALDNSLLCGAAFGIVPFSDDDQRLIFTMVETLMTKAGIAIRDTWKGFDGDNIDDLKANNMQSCGPRSIRFIKADDTHTAGFTNKENLDLRAHSYQSCAFEDNYILLPERATKMMHPLVHEVVHFLQHVAPDGEIYQAMKSTSDEHYLEYVSQRYEQEAHFVQLLYIGTYELDIRDEAIKKEFLEKLDEALVDFSKRVDLIIYAKGQAII